jgi:hypothetical protein
MTRSDRSMTRSMTRSERIAVLLLGAMVLAAPLAGRWLRRDNQSRCAWDGLPVQALYRVRVVDAADTSREFCCVRCAAAWLTQHGAAHAVHVTDEASGSEIDAGAAHFVQSAVSTNPITRNSIHAFKKRSDAEEHADTFGGRLLTDEERPF